MRSPFLLVLLLAVASCFYVFEEDPVEYRDDFYSDSESRNLFGPADLPKTPAQMMARFNANFLRFLANKEKADWDRLMIVLKPNAHIETCMEASYGLSMSQFHRWMTYLSKYYVEVGLTSTVITDSSDNDVSTELTYRTEVRNGQKGSDKWAMSATMDAQKGHFMINALTMISDCKNIPKYPPLEPAVPLETFIANLRTKLVSDIFLNEALHYKSAYESVFPLFMPTAAIKVCDVGQMTPTQFVDYWYKRYGKIQTYQDHYWNVTKKDKDTIVDFAVTYKSEDGSFFRDRYRFEIRKYFNLWVEYFENFMDWTIMSAEQHCTENVSKMSKSDESLVKMSLASRRWDQLFMPTLTWNTLDAFMELFDHTTLNGYGCPGRKFNNADDLSKWLEGMRGFFRKSIPKATNVYQVEGEKLGFRITNEMVASDNSTSTHYVFFEGYYKDSSWKLNHLGFSCNI